MFFFFKITCRLSQISVGKKVLKEKVEKNMTIDNNLKLFICKDEEKEWIFFSNKKVIISVSLSQH